MGNTEGNAQRVGRTTEVDALAWLNEKGLHRQAEVLSPERVRLALIGPQQSGKSSIASRFLRNSFSVEHRLDKVVRHGVRSVALGTDGEKWVDLNECHRCL